MAENKQAEEISFEAALNEIENIVRKLETGNSDLDKSIEMYEKGCQLIKFAENKLNAAKLKVEKIVKNQSGEATTEEFKA